MNVIKHIIVSALMALQLLSLVAQAGTLTMGSEQPVQSSNLTIEHTAVITAPTPVAAHSHGADLAVHNDSSLCHSENEDPNHCKSCENEQCSDTCQCIFSGGLAVFSETPIASPYHSSILPIFVERYSPLPASAIYHPPRS